MNAKIELDEIKAICRELSQKLLIEKSEQNPEWQASIAASIAKAASFYSQTTGNAQSALSDEENITCLLTLAYVEYAAAIGNKEAKKRNLNIKYWDINPFPSVTQNIGSKELQIAAYKKLSVTKNQASEEYLKAELVKESELDVRRAQFNWLLKVKGSAGLFLETINELSNTNKLLNLLCDSIEYISEQIKKKLLPIDEALCKALNNQLSLSHATNNTNLESLHTELVSVICLIKPEITLSAEFLMYVLTLKRIGKDNKKLAKIIDTLSRRYFDLVESIGKIEQDYIRSSYITDLAKAYSLNIIGLENLKKQNLNKYTFFLQAEKISPNSITNIENAAIELAISWSEYQPCNKPSAQSGYMGKKIINLLQALNIEQYSTAGEIKNFDPTKDESVSKDSHSYTKVNVIKPGFINIRPNGTIRVIRKAIVEKIDG